MKKTDLFIIKNLFNQLELVEIKFINEKTLMLDFQGDVRLFIDASSAGIDLSLTAITPEAVQIINTIIDSSN